MRNRVSLLVFWACGFFVAASIVLHTSFWIEPGFVSTRLSDFMSRSVLILFAASLVLRLMSRDTQARWWPNDFLPVALYAACGLIYSLALHTWTDDQHLILSSEWCWQSALALLLSARPQTPEE